MRKALRDMIKNPQSSQMGKPLPWDLLFPQIARAQMIKDQLMITLRRQIAPFCSTLHR